MIIIVKQVHLYLFQMSVYRTIGPLVLCHVRIVLLFPPGVCVWIVKKLYQLPAPHILNLYFSELDFKCLATWESGEKFMYGKFTQPGTSLDSGAYRCFVSTPI